MEFYGIRWFEPGERAQAVGNTRPGVGVVILRWVLGAIARVLSRGHRSEPYCLLGADRQLARVDGAVSRT